MKTGGWFTWLGVCLLALCSSPVWGQTQAQMLYPLDGATNVEMSLQSFQWTSVAGAQAYYLYVGTAVGAKDVVDSRETQQTSYPPRVLPGGQTLFIRLWTESGGVWRFIDTQFTTTALASLTAPIAGAANIPLSQTFTWTSVPGAQAYYLYVGTAVGAKDLVDSRETQLTSFQAALLPGGRTLYARLWTELGGTWSHRDTQFTTVALASLTSPSAGATDVESTRTFVWTSVPNAQAYYLYVGTSIGAKDIVDSREIHGTLYLPGVLPPARTLYARLWTETGGTWRSLDSQFTTAPTANLTSPYAGALNVDLIPTFTWTSVPGAQAYDLYVGATVGANDLVDSRETQLTTYHPPSLPGGRVLYARLWTKWGSAWRFVDSQFTTAPLARLLSPSTGATNVSPLGAFTWEAVPNAQAYYLYVGSTVGAKDIIDSHETQQTRYQPAPMPAARLLYARLWTKWSNGWRFVDSQFTTAPIATLTSLLDGSVNVDPRQPFTWTSVPGADAYYLYVGSSLGANDYVSSGELTGTSYAANSAWAQQPDLAVTWDERPSASAAGYAMVLDSRRFDFGLVAPRQCPVVEPSTSCYQAPLPTLSPGLHTIQLAAYSASGETAALPFTFTQSDGAVYARLWTKTAGAWRYVDTRFTPANLTPRFTYPQYGATDADPTLPVAWTVIAGADTYSLTVGAALGGSEIANVGDLHGTSYLVHGLAGLSGARRVFARVGARVNGTWRYTNTTFAVLPVATLTYPVDGLTQVPRATSFSWNVSSDAQAYDLYVGTTPGAKDVVNTGEIQGGQFYAINLPPTTTLYARLWTKAGGVWRYVDSRFVTAP